MKPFLSFNQAMDHYDNIYKHQADKYHRLISVEDVDNNLISTMSEFTPILSRRVLDLGSGTGRIPLLLHSQVEQIIAVDINRCMLQEQQQKREQMNGTWGLLQGDLRVLPFPENEFDIVTAGWAIGHFQGWYPVNWHTQVDRAVNDMIRIVKPGGVLIIIETLTTGGANPAPPTEGLAEYYTWLEDKWGFTHKVISTDYQFRDLDEAVELVGFFFGEELAQKVQENNWVRLPEWTGVWGKVTSK
ncbi:class I SAM-dependent methyltransferase [Chloroflexota bacterium]